MTAYVTRSGSTRLELDGCEIVAEQGLSNR